MIVFSHTNSNQYLQNMCKPIYKFVNLDKVEWLILSYNPNAIHILEKNISKVDWFGLSSNTNAHLLLCKLDYKKMKLNTKDFSRELAEHVFHPERLIRICEKNDLELCDLLDIL